MVATEAAVIAPVILILVLIPVHLSLWWLAKHAVDLAAEEALDAAQIDGATTADGEAAARNVLGHVANVDNPDITVTITGDVVVVEITAEARYQVIPGPWNVAARAEGRVERFIGEQER
jgi:Flp pilus assembly protein TadG